MLMILLPFILIDMYLACQIIRIKRRERDSSVGT